MENIEQASKVNKVINQYDDSSSKPMAKTVKDSIAKGMGKAAQALHQQADKASDAHFADFGHQAAQWLETSADYVQSIEPQKMRADLENQVRQNPAKSLLIAGAAGLALGIFFRRRA